VKIGREAGGEYEIVSGLKEGEEIVTSANFLIDSESRFQSAVSSFGKQVAPQPSEHAH
jgi:Cu(I)/Ag(I) efflux system membrane fusion protein